MSDTVEQFDPTELDPMRREMNKSLMVAWINAGLLDRAACDVRKSVVLYDADKVFEGATPEPLSEELLKRLYERTSVRFWSVGV